MKIIARGFFVVLIASSRLDDDASHTGFLGCFGLSLTRRQWKIQRPDNRIRRKTKKVIYQTQSSSLVTLLSVPENSSLSSSSQQQQRQQSPRRKKEGNQIDYESRLYQSTLNVLDKSRIPLGQLTSDDVGAITGLMACWARQKYRVELPFGESRSQAFRSALIVEQLLKRVVDDMNAGNRDVRVSTCMYTMAIDAWAKTNTNSYRSILDIDSDTGEHHISNKHTNTKISNYGHSECDNGSFDSIVPAERAHQIHESMVELYNITKDPNIRPSTISYNAVINAWSKAPTDYYTIDPETHQVLVTPQMAENVLHDMLHRWKAEGDDKIKPDVVSFTSCIDAWAKWQQDNNGEAILKRKLRGDQSKNKVLKVKGAKRALQLLRKMEKLYKQEGQLEMKPNVYTFSAIINAFAKTSDFKAPRFAQAVLSYMKTLYEQGDEESKPNVVNYNSVINAWGRCKAPGSALKAEQLLRTMQTEGVEPDALSFTLVVSGWAHSNEPDATERAQLILSEMEAWALEKTSNGTKKPANSGIPGEKLYLDVECYNTVLISLSRRDHPDTTDRAVSILSRMIHLADTYGFETVRPVVKSWNAVLNAIARSHDPHSAQKCEAILNSMFAHGIKPNVYSFVAVLHAYQKSSQPGSAKRAHEIVRTMEKLYLEKEISSPPDVYHYTIVCSCWAKSGEDIAAEQCGQILKYMESRAKAGYHKVKPNVRTYNAVIDAYARAKKVDIAEKILFHMIKKFHAGEIDVKPDSFTFNSVINAWTRCRKRDSGERAEMVLNQLLEFSSKYNTNAKADSRSFSHILDYYARRREPGVALRAQKLLYKMIDCFKNGHNVAPNVFCFTAVINAYAKNRDPQAGIVATKMKDLQTSLYEKHGLLKLKPNTFLMNTVLYAWSQSGDAEAGPKAEKILKEMEAKYALGIYEMRPNTRTFGLVLSSWSRSIVLGKGSYAFHVLEQMEKQSLVNENVLPNVHCYNAVINACAFSHGDTQKQREAFDIAVLTMEKLQNSKVEGPISSTYGTFLKACGKLSVPASLSQSHIDKAFRQCREDGLVNDFVLTQLRYSSSTVTYKKLLGGLIKSDGTNQRLTMKDIPKDWQRNNIERVTDDERGDWWSSSDE